VQAGAGRTVHALQRGAVVRRDLRGRLARLAAPSTPVRLALAQVLAVAAPLACAALGAPWAATGAAAVAAATAAVALTRRLAIAPLDALVRDANHLASGDLSHTVQTGASGSVGQLQRALFQLCVNLRTVVRDVRAELQRLDTSVREIARGNHDLSSRTEAQAGSLEQTAASMEQINGTVHSSAASAGQGARFAAEATATTQRGSDSVQAVGATMEGIASASRHIEGIVQIIEGVAFQTNLLALNAAVEAARAGEQGRGFAVVAAEVRNLAGRSGEAAKQIRTLIDDSNARVSAGNAQASAAGRTMGEVVQSIQRLSAMVGQISNASQEQASGVAQVGEAVTALDQVTQQNAALVEEMAAAAGSLSSQAQALVQAVAVFREGGGGARPALPN
jgi:aerotaxis receptor